MTEGAPRVLVEDVAVELGGVSLLSSTAFTAGAGEVLAVVGPSGSGKTTLLHCLTGVRVPSAGRVVVDGVEVSSLDGRRRAAFRQASCGVVFQDAELLDELSVVENVALPLIFAGVDRKRALVRAQEALAEVGCDHLVDRRPTRISGGEAQRTALARAFVDNPPLIVADEPTAALDAENTMVVGELLRRQAREHDAAVVVATHDPALAALCDDVVALREAAVGAGR